MEKRTTLHTDGGIAAEVDTDTLTHCRFEMRDALTRDASYDEIEDIMTGDLGLEMDYFMDVMGL